MRDHPVDVARSSARRLRARPWTREERFFTATLKISLPTMWTLFFASLERSACVSGSAAAARDDERLASEPSVKILVERTPRPSSSLGGPEHHRARAVAEEHAGRAILQLSTRERSSTPITRTQLHLAGANELIGDREAVDEARRRRRRCRTRGSRSAPSFCCTCTAQAGIGVSPVTVPTMIMSRSAAVSPAASSAALRRRRRPCRS